VDSASGQKPCHTQTLRDLNCGNLAVAARWVLHFTRSACYLHLHDRDKFDNRVLTVQAWAAIMVSLQRMELVDDLVPQTRSTERSARSRSQRPFPRPTTCTSCIVAAYTHCACPSQDEASSYSA
jgi:hypothetical protein